MKRTRKWIPYLFVAPAVLILVFCSIIPILMAFGISFTNLSMQQLGRWELVSFVGLDNYITIFEDSVFRKSITNTFYYVIIGVPAVILVSFFLAYLLHSGGEKKIFSFFRAVFYSPSVTNMVAISIVWLYLFNPSIGLFNRILNAFGMESILWLNDPDVAKNSLLIFSVWKNMGLNIPLFRVLLVLLSSILSACVAAFAGPVSFVGIAVPHLTKRLFGTAKPILMIPACFLGGASFCLGCDLLARILFAPTELSISTVTAVFGAPVVIVIMLKGKRERTES